MPVDGKIWNITFQFRQSLRALHSYDIAGLNVFLWINKPELNMTANVTGLFLR